MLCMVEVRVNVIKTLPLLFYIYPIMHVSGVMTFRSLTITISSTNGLTVCIIDVCSIMLYNIPVCRYGMIISTT